MIASMAATQDVAQSGSVDSSLAQPSRHNEADSALYQYEPLQSPSHIRILKIEPGDQTTSLRCSLIQMSLDDGPIFEALSYAWGEANHLYEVGCDGKIIKITQNLHDALESMRLKGIKLLWADAICINQKDPIERGAQVQLMSRIYSQADRVLLWLGRHQRQVDVAMAYLGFFRSFEEQKEWYRKFILMFQDSSSRLKQEVEDALICLFARPVFGRGWVIQEVALAKRIDIHWGYAVVDFDSFYGVINREAEALTNIAMTNDKGNGFSELFMMYNIRKLQQQGHAIDPLVLIRKTRHYRFSDERDRIYGILALQMSGTEQLLNRTFVQVDYIRDKWHAFQTFTEACLIREGLLATLFHTRNWDETTTDRPSWVPDWCKHDAGWSDVVTERIGCGDEKSPVQKCNEGHISIRGFSVTKVGSLLGCHNSEHTNEEAQTFLRTIWDSFDSVCVAKTASALVPYLEDPLHGFVNDKHSLCDVLAIACREFLDLNLTEEPLVPFLPFAVDESGIGRFFGRIYIGQMKDQAFFRSNQGNLGLGPRNLQEGDTIVILFSGSGPNLSFVLRPAGPFWKLVGPCYMYHLTDGSAVRKWKQSGEPAETFIIC